MKNVIDLKDKQIMITGASSGIGRETAILCSKLGAKCILIARDLKKLEFVLGDLEGEGHKYYSFDLSRLDEIGDFLKKVISESGSLDGFVHSAGIGSTRPLQLLKPADLRAVMDINCFSFIEMCRCLIKKRGYNKGLSIVGVSSISSKQGNKAKTAYCASKAAMDAAVRCMAKELAEKKIRVNTVNPALINTEIYQQFTDYGCDKGIIERQYLGLGEPIDVANAITFLLSNASQFITGSNLDVDGGRLSS